jgi:hypothetical protein
VAWLARKPGLFYYLGNEFPEYLLSALKGVYSTPAKVVQDIVSFSGGLKPPAIHIQSFQD